MGVPCAIALLLLATACDRNSPPDVIGTPTVAPATTAAVSEPAVVEPASTAKQTKADAPRKAGAGKPRPATRAAAHGDAARSAENDPCAGLDGVELDDCLGFDGADQDAGDDVGNDQASRDFAAEQARRDRELLERDADEAAARMRDGNLEDELAVDDGYDPYPPYEQDLPPPEDDDYSEPPFEDDAGW